MQGSTRAMISWPACMKSESSIMSATVERGNWHGLVWSSAVSHLRSFETCSHRIVGLRGTDAEAAFHALGQEIWMVEREDAAGSVLRHRPDLRARTLPLMRRKNPDSFNTINRAAVEYFEKRRSRSEQDYAEWIYHRMLADEPIQDVERDFVPGILPMLARAESDFPPDSAAASYLAARTTKSRLSPQRVRRLSPVDALYHLTVTSPGAFGLDDTELDQVALEVSERIHRSERVSFRAISCLGHTLCG